MPLFAETVSTAVIAAVALIGGAALGTLGTWYQTRHKITELRVAEALRREGDHLQNAREHTEHVYIPLGVALARLQDSFFVMRADGEGSQGQPGEQTITRFRDAIEVFLRAIDELTTDGRHLFLTHDLSARLRDFAAFVRASQSASEVRSTVVIRSFSTEWKGDIAGRARRMLGIIGSGLTISAAVGVPLLGLAVVESADTVFAPLESREFEERFQRDIAAIETSIRDVTLGAPA